jgi:site-specific recombinase XerD
MKNLATFRMWLIKEEKSPLTVEKYLRDVRAFLGWLGTRSLEKGAVLGYKEALVEKYATASVNSMLSSLNCWLDWSGRGECRVKILKTQRQAFCSEERELTKGEYQRLLRAAEKDRRLCLLMQAICATGIRVSEHRFLTVEALKKGYATVRSKGKIRTVFIPQKLCKTLLSYAKSRKIQTGPIFIGRAGNPLDRSRIWAMMKGICAAAGVSEKKVFPHNLRHLFARIFYGMERDIVRLADILGHSSINTTRIYTMESGYTHRQQIERMWLRLITS